MPDHTETGPWAREVEPGILHMDLVAPSIHCAGCVSRIEKGLADHPAVSNARVNLSTKRIGIDWRQGESDPEELIKAVGALGFEAKPFDAGRSGTSAREATGRQLMKAMAVAGFAMANIMLLSVSVWSGAEGATRDMFHWVSALIALPAIAYAGRPFFSSAWNAIKARALNMDVPISLAVLLAAGMSLAETMRGAQHAYFDAAIMLLFFLLVGRYLDHMMRARAQSAVTQLLALTATGATVIGPDGSRTVLPVDRIEPDMLVAVTAGERVPVDGEIVDGASDLDRSMVTGEATPEPVASGDTVHAGTMNLTGPFTLKVSAAGEDTFLAEIVRLMEGAERSKGRYVRLADRAARFYAPSVHALAAITFVGWLLWTGGDWHTALLIAISTLIITCPCALGLAVPAVQVVASGALFRRGVLVKDGAGLEKLGQIDTVIFDKTGTLTLGEPDLTGPVAVDLNDLALAAGLAQNSSHPLSRALARVAKARGIEAISVADTEEVPGHGLEGRWGRTRVRLGRPDWCGADPADHDGMTLCLQVGDRAQAVFRFTDRLRPDAEAAFHALRDRGIRPEILSGDAEAAVDAVADVLGVTRYRATQTPQDKLAYVDRLAAEGRRVLMVGDGINDAPALAAGHVSMAPASASDIGRTAADFVFTGDSLMPVVQSLDVARASNRLVRQNFSLALVYNFIAIPVAVLGFVTPLVAAVAMSASSIVVTGNALRLRWIKLPESQTAGHARDTAQTSLPAGREAA